MKTLDKLITVLTVAKEELAKAIKPGPALNYDKINPKVDRVAQEAAAPTINYSAGGMTAPKLTPGAGAADRTKAVRAKIDAEGKETAIETINRKRGSVNKAEEPHKDDPKHEAKEKAKAKKIKDEAEDLLDMHKADGAPPPPPPNAAAQSIMGAFGRSEEDEDSEVIKGEANGQWSINKIKAPKKK